MLNFFRVINFRGFRYPRKFFSNEIFPDYGITSVMDSNIVDGLQFYKLSITLESMYSAYTSLWLYYKIIIHVTIIAHIASVVGLWHAN